MKYFIKDNQLISEDSKSLFNLDEIESVGYGLPCAYNLTLNYKNGKKIILLVSGDMNAKKLYDDINKILKKCNCSSFDLLHKGHSCFNFKNI